MAPQKGECGKKKGKVRKNTVKVHKDVQEYSTDKTCGARERKNARNVPKWRNFFIFTVRKSIKVGEKMEIQGQSG